MGEYETNKQLILEEIKAELASQLTAQAADHASVFSEVFFKRVPVAELSQETPGFFAAMVISQLNFLQKRKRGDLSIRVFNPEKERGDWDGHHTVAELANDDMPFLVDTVSMVLQELNLVAHLIIHPILNAERDADGNLKALHPRATNNSVKESFIHIHLERQTDPTVLASVKSFIESCMAQLRLTVTDWHLMKKSLEIAIADFGKNAPDLPSNVRKECIEFLEWVGNDHFIFIGALK